MIFGNLGKLSILTLLSEPNILKGFLERIIHAWMNELVLLSLELFERILKVSLTDVTILDIGINS